MPEIHSTSIVSGDANIGEDVDVGAYAIIGPGVTIGSGSRVGPHTRIEGPTTLGERNQIDGHATIGAFSAVHQFCRVGDHAFIGGFTVVTQDALPYIKTVGDRPAKTYGINTIGLQRKGFSAETIDALDRAYRILVRSKLKLQDALQTIEGDLSFFP